jgi:hypothetical protein
MGTVHGEAPDRIEPVRGWRVWDVVLLDGAPRLCSLAFWSIWIPGKAARATCRRVPLEGVVAGLPPHDAPAEACRCGLYATVGAAETLQYSQNVGRRGDTVHRVIGRVSLWGTVIECEGGWRGALGYPAAVFVPAVRRRRLRGGLSRAGVPVEQIAEGLEVYGVPVELLDASSNRDLQRLLEPSEDAR